MEIRKLAPSEWQLFKKYVEWNADSVDQLPKDESLKAWMVDNRNHAFLALEQDEVIGGLTAYTIPMYSKVGRELFIYELDVDPSWQGRGLGTALVAACLAWCASADVDCAYVATEPENHPANKVYAKAGGSLEKVNWWVYELRSAPSR